MVTLARISTNRTSGAPESKSKDKEIVEELKGLNKKFKDFASVGGMVGTVYGALQTSIPALAILSSVMQRQTEGTSDKTTPIEGLKQLSESLGLGSKYGYVETDIGGETMYSKIDNATGEIVEILSKDRAQREGILDDLGNIKEEHSRLSKKAQETVDSYTKWRDGITLASNEYTDEGGIISLTRNAKILQESINKNLQAWLDALNNQGFVATSAGESFIVPSKGTPNSYSEKYGIGFDAQGNGYSSIEQITTVNNPQVNSKNRFEDSASWIKKLTKQSSGGGGGGAG